MCVCICLVLATHTFKSLTAWYRCMDYRICNHLVGWNYLTFTKHSLLPQIHEGFEVVLISTLWSICSQFAMLVIITKPYQLSLCSGLMNDGS